MTTIPNESKIRLLLDHQGKPLKRPQYGYVVLVMDASKYPDGFATEKPEMTRSGMAYLIQTSWTGGALWYTADAFKLAKGQHKLVHWRRRLEKAQRLEG